MGYGSVNVPGNLPNKQDLLTGTAGQAVGFGTDGAAQAVQGWSSPNLLDNWDFVDPVNQRGVTGTISTAGYFIDRWKLVSGSVKITSGGLVLNGTIAQVLETAPIGTLTATALTTSGIAGASYDASTKTFSISATGQTITAAKLELSSIQTLAHQDADGNWVLSDPPPNKALELEKCQRHMYNPFYNASGKYNRLGLGYRGGESRVNILIPLPTTMRGRPTVTNLSNMIIRKIGDPYSKDVVSISTDHYPIVCT